MHHSEDANLMQGNNVNDHQIQTYKRRWVMLLLFSLLSASNSLQWITYGSLANQFETYYEIDSFWINFQSLIYMIVFIPFVWPSAWIVHRFGLSKGLIIASITNSTGAWLRCLATGPNTFYWAVIGQGVSAFSQTFILEIPALLSSNWFPPNERATATSIGALFNQAGIALGFVPPLFISSSNQFPLLLMVEAIICTSIGALCVLFFRSQPPTPPSLSAAIQPKHIAFSKILIGLVTNRDFIFMFFGFGIITGMFYALSTLFNQMLSSLYTDSEIGILGILLVISGVFGAGGAGVISDKLQRPKLLLLIFYGLSVLLLLAFVLVMSRTPFVVLCIISFLLGMFLNGLLPLSFEAIVGSTYPAPEATTSGLILMSAQIFGILMIVIIGEFEDWFGNWNVAWWTFLAISTFAFGLIIFFRAEDKRKLADEGATITHHDHQEEH